MINQLLTKILIKKGYSDVNCMLKNARNARAANEKTLFKILNENKDSEYGKKYHFKDIHSLEDYQRMVPICTYDDISSYVERIYYDNEQNVLTSDKIIGFSTTSGSVGKPKIIPLTEKQVRIYTKYTVTRMLALADKYWKENKGIAITHGTGIPLLDTFSGESPHGLPKTNIVDIAAKKYGRLYPYILNLPMGGLFQLGSIDSTYACARFGLANKDALYIFSVFSNSVDDLINHIKNNWEKLCDEIEKGRIDDSFCFSDSVRKKLSALIKPDPKRAAELREEFRKGFDETILSRIWPNMKFINMIGTSPCFEPYTRNVLNYSKGIPIDYSIYGASEGLFAAAYACDNPGQLMLLDSCFYEFIEQTDRPDEANPLLVDQLEDGKNYEIIITNTSGLYRYKFKDIITVVGHVDTCPVVQFSHRDGQLVNVVAEKTNLEHMQTAIDIFEEKTGLKVNKWTITMNKGGPGGCYLIYFEGDGDADYLPYSKVMDEALSAVNYRYGEFRELNLINPAVVKTQIKGTHDEWRKLKIAAGVSPAQVKPVTVLDSDEKKEFFSSRLVP